MSVAGPRVLERINAPFEHGGCLNIGHTVYVISPLRTDHAVFSDRTTERFGGGPLRPDLDRCFQRLGAWAELARE
eukprot:1312079-Lingulodinium_polyedra.AAC.1